MHPSLRSVAQGEFLGELAVVVAKPPSRKRVRRLIASVRRIGIDALEPAAVLVGKAVVAHDQRGQAIGQGIDAGARLGVGALVGPHNVEARVDARDGEAVQGRVAEAERSEVVSVRQLLRSAWSVGVLNRGTSHRAARAAQYSPGE